MDLRIPLIVCLMLHIVKACFSSGSPAPPPTSPPNDPGDKLDCHPGEKVCLHGGTCFATLVGGVRLAHCKCPVGYTGDYCEKKTGPEILPNTASRAEPDVGAIVGIVLAVVIIFFITLAVFFLVLRKRRLSEKPKLEDPYTYSQANKPDPSRTTNDNFGVGRHMYPTGTHVDTIHSTIPPHSGQRNRAFETNSPTKPSIKRADHPDHSMRHQSTLSSSSRPSSNNGSVFHHNTSVQSSASNCPVAHHESTV